MSDANLSTLASVRETTPGTAPNDGLKLIRFTKESLGFKKETVTSAEIRSDRQVSDSVKVFGQPAGSIDFECSFGQLIPIVELAMMNLWNQGEITASLTFAGNSIAAESGTWDDIPVGTLIQLFGGTANNTGFFRIIAKASNGLSVQVANKTFTTGTEASVTIRWKTITNGTSLKSEMFEKMVAEGAYSVFRGMAVDTLDLAIESKKIVTGTINLIGMAYEEAAVTSDPQQVYGEQAQGTFTFAGQPSSGDTINIGITKGGRQYIFVSSGSGGADAANEILIGATLDDTLDALVAAVNGTEHAGVGPNTVAHPLVTAGRGSGNTFVVAAREYGAAGNDIDIAESATNVTVSGAHLTGGVDAVVGYIAAGVDPVVNGTNNFGTLTIDGSTSQERLKSIKLKIANNIRGKDACGTEGNFDIGLGRFEVTGSLNAYFRDSFIQAKSTQHQSMSLEFYLENEYGGRIYFYLPCLKLTGDPTIEGVNTDIMIDTAFEAIVGDSTAARMLIIDHVDID